MVEIKVTQPRECQERIERLGKPTMEGVKNCKSFRKVLQTLIGQNTRRNNKELVFYTQGILNLYNKFHPEQIAEVEVKSWKNRSSFEIIKHLDRLTIIKYIRKDKDSEPKKIMTEVSKEEIQAMIDSLLKFPIGQEIETKALSMVFSETLNLGHDGWKRGNNPIFSDRSLHNKYTLLLGALQEYNLVEYKGGKTKLLNKNISIQLIL